MSAADYRRGRGRQAPPGPGSRLTQAAGASAGERLRLLERVELARPGHRGDVDEPEVVPADDQLVAVAQRVPLDPLAVDEDAVERAVVEHAHAVGAAYDEGVAA